MTMDQLKALPEHDREYLGDGVYAGYLYGSLWLVAPREDGDHFICLGDSELRALTAFHKTILGR